jgi:hypothetical protein
VGNYLEWSSFGMVHVTAKFDGFLGADSTAKLVLFLLKFEEKKSGGIFV